MIVTCDVVVEEYDAATGATVQRQWRHRKHAVELERTSEGGGWVLHIPGRSAGAADSIAVALARAQYRVFSAQLSARGLCSVRFSAPLRAALYLSNPVLSADLQRFADVLNGKPLPPPSVVPQQQSPASQPGGGTSDKENCPPTAAPVASTGAFASPTAKRRAANPQQPSPSALDGLSPASALTVRQSKSSAVLSRPAVKRKLPVGTAVLSAGPGASAPATGFVPSKTAKRSFGATASSGGSSTLLSPTSHLLVDAGLLSPPVAAPPPAGAAAAAAVLSPRAEARAKAKRAKEQIERRRSSAFSVAALLSEAAPGSTNSAAAVDDASQQARATAAAAAQDATERAWRLSLHARRRAAFADALANNNALNSEQKRVLELVRDGHSVFFSGSAGTGKSHVLQCLLGQCLSAGPGNPYVAATSTTGVTATHLGPGGVTLYAWAGIGGGDESKEALLQRLQRNRDALDRWQRVTTLVIDEVSMLSADAFDKLEFLGSALRGGSSTSGAGKRFNPCAKPFGGIQLVLCGDFYQLPPVLKSGGGAAKVFAFEADAWPATITRTVELTQVFRQTDPHFVAVLNDIRRGVLTESAFRLLSSRAPKPAEADAKADAKAERKSDAKDAAALVPASAPPPSADGIVATLLETRKVAVDALNTAQLMALPGSGKLFVAKQTGTSERLLEQLRNACPARLSLALKVGAQVIVVKNVNVAQGVCNGSRGVVTRFLPEPAAAASNRDTARTAAVQRDEAALNATYSEGWPVVRLVNGKEFVIRPETWTLKVAGATERATATIEALPLELGWAVSVHKSQGMSLDRVRCNLQGVFEYGQAYVALSRVRSLEGLELSGLDRRRTVRAHPRVAAFYQSLAASAAAALAVTDAPVAAAAVPTSAAAETPSAGSAAAAAAADSGASAHPPTASQFAPSKAPTVPAASSSNGGLLSQFAPRPGNSTRPPAAVLSSVASAAPDVSRSTAAVASWKPAPQLSSSTAVAVRAPLIATGQPAVTPATPAPAAAAVTRPAFAMSILRRA